MNPISQRLRYENSKEEIERLEKIHYMSPQGPDYRGHGFACEGCSWMKALALTSTAVMVGPDLRHCDLAKAKVEYNGCCNKFEDAETGVST